MKKLFIKITRAIKLIFTDKYILLTWTDMLTVEKGALNEKETMIWAEKLHRVSVADYEMKQAVATTEQILNN